MMSLWKIFIKRHLHKHNKVPIFTHFSLFIIALALFSIASNACTTHDYGYHLNIENLYSTSLTFDVRAITQSGDNTDPRSLGVLSAGQIKDTWWMWIYKSTDIALMPKILLQGKDSSGKIVWQKTWTGAEFIQLKNTGWKIIVSPETSEPLTAP